MFSSAAAQHSAWSCRIYAGKADNRILPAGCGCALDERHTLTAYHVAHDLQEAGRSVIVLGHGGIYESEVVLADPAADIAVLRLTRPLQKPHARITRFPELSNKPPFFGASVGIMSQIQFPSAVHGSDNYPHFSAGVVSVLFPARGDESETFGLSSIFAQQGFSGSAAFYADGSICGVFTSSLRFRIDRDDPESEFYKMPVISPIKSNLNRIKAILAEGQTPQPGASAGVCDVSSTLNVLQNDRNKRRI